MGALIALNGPRLAVLCGVSLLVIACGGGPVPSPLPRPPAGEAPPGAARPEAPAEATSPALAPTPGHVGPLNAAISEADLDALWARQMMLPVEGIKRSALRDSYTAGRSNGRTHAALDILAPRSTPVLAATDCVIGRLSNGSIGGIVIYAYDPDEQFVYYYAHLERYRRGLKVGDRIAKGSVIGYVGTTGNAPKNTPHLHFQVMKRGAGRAWWDGPPINPISYFASDGDRP